MVGTLQGDAAGKPTPAGDVAGKPTPTFPRNAGGGRCREAYAGMADLDYETFRNKSLLPIMRAALSRGCLVMLHIYESMASDLAEKISKFPHYLSFRIGTSSRYEKVFVWGAFRSTRRRLHMEPVAATTFALPPSPASRIAKEKTNCGTGIIF